MKSLFPSWPENHVPYICWDRDWTVSEIRRRLQTGNRLERQRLMAWLMRELKTTEVWLFLDPQSVFSEFEDIKRWLGPSRPLWEYVFRSWHELGKV